MAKQKLKEGSIILKPAPKDGAVFRYLKSTEWFSPTDYHKLNKRIQLFSRRYHVYITSDDNLYTGDIVMDDANIGKVISCVNGYNARVEVFKSLNEDSVMVYDNVGKRFIVKTIAVYIEDLDIHTLKTNAMSNDTTGKHTLLPGVVFDGCHKKITFMFSTYRVKVVSTSDNSIPVPTLSSKALNDIIALNGALDTVYYYVKGALTHVKSYIKSKK